MLRLIVARLGECAEHGEHGVLWRDPRNAARQPDLGMAHGAAGVIALLVRIVQEGPASPEATSLLTAAVDGVLSRSSRGAAEDDDLAWCAGNAGLSIALLAASRACGRDDWESTARHLAAAAAERYLDDAGGFDPALCHGTAGLSHLFHRFYQATGDPGLLAAARRWMERTLAQRRPGQGIGGYQSRGRQADGRIGWIPDPGFLGGAAGIGLALLAAATPMEPAWDRALLLSGMANKLK
jgi:lantibiotic modifying enzyme